MDLRRGVGWVEKGEGFGARWGVELIEAGGEKGSRLG